MADPDLVRWDLLPMGPDGPYQLTIHHAQGSLVELFESVEAALVRQGELEELLRTARAGEKVDPWISIDEVDSR